MAASDIQADGTVRLGQAISSYVSALPPSERESAARELSRLGRWLGTDRPVAQITPVDVARYQEQFTDSSVDVNARLQPVKAFLNQLKARKLTDINLGAHIRLRRPTGRRPEGATTQRESPTIRVTQEGFKRLHEELEELERTVRPKVTEDLARAFADKDFRENAPYDAAKERLAEVQGRITDIRNTLAAATIDAGQSTETADLGTTVTLRSLDEDEELEYTIVGPGEVSPRQGKISLQSPLGKALADRRAGEVVEVETPAGTHTYRIERIDRR